MLQDRGVATNDAQNGPAVAQVLRRDRWVWLRTLVALPAAILPLLPSVSCPICLAAYAGVLSALGVGFLLDDRVQRPLILLFLCITLGSVGWLARKHRTTGPFLVTLHGSIAIVAARLVWNIPLIAYVGTTCLIAGAIWNIKLRRAQSTAVQIRIGSAE